MAGGNETIPVITGREPKTFLNQYGKIVLSVNECEMVKQRRQIVVGYQTRFHMVIPVFANDNIIQRFK